MSLQPPPGPSWGVGQGAGVSGAGERVTLCLGKACAKTGSGEADSCTDGDWARPLHLSLILSQSG